MKNNNLLDYEKRISDSTMNFIFQEIDKIPDVNDYQKNDILISVICNVVYMYICASREPSERTRALQYISKNIKKYIVKQNMIDLSKNQKDFN